MLLKWGLINTREDLDHFAQAGLHLYEALCHSNSMVATARP